MSNPLYESMKGNPSSAPMNPMQVLQQLKSNPAEFLRSKGFNMPDGVDVNNPQSIISGLLQSGQINNNRYQQVLRMMGRR